MREREINRGGIMDEYRDVKNSRYHNDGCVMENKICGPRAAVITHSHNNSGVNVKSIKSSLNTEIDNNIYCESEQRKTKYMLNGK